MSLAFPKPEKPIRGTAEAKRYMADVARLPCCICGTTPVQVHHPIMGRFSQRKASDLDVIALCEPHHQGAFGIHTSPALWRSRYGLDTDYIPQVRAAVEKARRETIGGRA